MPTASAPILTHDPYRATICAAKRRNLSAAWTHTTSSLHERSSAFHVAAVAANANPPVWPSTARTSEKSSRNDVISPAISPIRTLKYAARFQRLWYAANASLSLNAVTFATDDVRSSNPRIAAIAAFWLVG